ncbi:MGMT family protein [Arthrobacter sp. UCD-GKA]|jgi:alkylated DNA nucleotide flippase Atl1|uniref:MGMT family protein n=1 Tax=Arthrobacter sp. UCD-GKA TaxID=1913576 RepID=UPI0025708C85|nr:MGMT family protein [Arthrobacter sp. UCD-GKA]
MSMEPVEVVRAIVVSIPAGSVASYGEIGRLAGVGPRQAGRLVARLDEDVPWWRVVYADGTPATCHDGGARALLEAEGVPFRDGRVDIGKIRGDGIPGQE